MAAKVKRWSTHYHYELREPFLTLGYVMQLFPKCLKYWNRCSKGLAAESFFKKKLIWEACQCINLLSETCFFCVRVWRLTRNSLLASLLIIWRGCFIPRFPSSRFPRIWWNRFFLLFPELSLRVKSGSHCHSELATREFLRFWFGALSFSDLRVANFRGSDFFWVTIFFYSCSKSLLRRFLSHGRKHLFEYTFIVCCSQIIW